MLEHVQYAIYRTCSIRTYSACSMLEHVLYAMVPSVPPEDSEPIVALLHRFEKQKATAPVQNAISERSVRELCESVCAYLCVIVCMSYVHLWAG